MYRHSIRLIPALSFHCMIIQVFVCWAWAPSKNSLNLSQKPLNEPAATTRVEVLNFCNLILMFICRNYTKTVLLFMSTFIDSWFACKKKNYNITENNKRTTIKRKFIGHYLEINRILLLALSSSRAAIHFYDFRHNSLPWFSVLFFFSIWIAMLIMSNQALNEKWILWRVQHVKQFYRQDEPKKKKNPELWFAEFLFCFNFIVVFVE